jgi:uncharacterized Zn finger protein (UPF0148 family)
MAKCPNCDAVLKKEPTRKTNCTICGRPIYVKSTPLNKARRLMTEEQALQADAEWAARAEQQNRERDLDLLRAVGIADTNLVGDVLLNSDQWKNAVWAGLRWAVNNGRELHKRKLAASTLCSMAENLEARVRWAATVRDLELLDLAQRGCGRAEVRGGRRDATCTSCSRLMGTTVPTTGPKQSLLPPPDCPNLERGAGCLLYFAPEPSFFSGLTPTLK